MPNFTRLDPGRPEIAILVDAMLRAREVIAARSWSTSQEPTSEHWWADILADPRPRIWRQARGFYGRDGRRTAQKSHYRLADEPSPLIEVMPIRLTQTAACGSVFVMNSTSKVFDIHQRDDLAFPKSLREFQKLFPDDAACAAYLERARWHGGFVC